jgi:glycerophosphoryl diester phosphodiesterase
MAAACGTGVDDYLVVHHRANGCSEDAPENSLAGVRCVVDACAAGVGLCALEIDIRVLRVAGGSLGNDLEIVLLHDDSTRRTAVCPGGPFAIPGDAPLAPEALAGCRLRRHDGAVTDEPLPRYQDLLAALAGTAVTLFLELKTAGIPALDQRLVEGALDRLGALRERTIVTSFDTVALRQVRAQLELPTACFAPVGKGLRQVLSALSGGTLRDVDRCLNEGHDYVFVPPPSLEGRIVAHVRRGGARLGVFGADTTDGHAAVLRWGHALNVVYADRPAMYGARAPNAR